MSAQLNLQTYTKYWVHRTVMVTKLQQKMFPLQNCKVFHVSLSFDFIVRKLYYMNCVHFACEVCLVAKPCSSVEQTLFTVRWISQRALKTTSTLVWCDASARTARTPPAPLDTIWRVSRAGWFVGWSWGSVMLGGRMEESCFMSGWIKITCTDNSNNYSHNHSHNHNHNNN